MSQPANLSAFITLAEVQSRSDTKTFARGKAYFHGGKVSRLDETDGSVRATVRGTQTYNVEITTQYGSLVCYCDCPVSKSSTFCKHGVAVALSWLENTGAEVFQPEETEPKKPRKKRKTYVEQVDEYVATLDADALRRWLMEAVERDVALRDKLLLAARSLSANDLPGMKSAVRQAASVRRALFDWREAAEYADGLFSLCDTLRARLKGPHAADVVDLAELAIAEAETSLERIDDSNGYVLPAIRELAEVHLEACERTGPDQGKLAERLFRFQLQGQWGTFSTVLPTYAMPLGDAGLRVYRELCSEAWNKLPPRLYSKSGDYSYDVHDARLRGAMAALAEFDGDVDALIRIESQDLSTTYRFLQIASLCRAHGRLAEGLAWAERGIEASKPEVDSSLLTFCIEAHLSRSEFDKADEYAWRRFVQHASAMSFKELMTVASATGMQDETRRRALDHMWALVAKEEAAKALSGVGYMTTRTELVELYLDLRDNDAAWNAFIGGPIAAEICRPMAAVRALTHPRDALVVYRRLLPGTIERGALVAKYTDAIDIVRAIGKLRAELGEAAQFEAELADIRQTYRTKRKFIALLDGI